MHFKENGAIFTLNGKSRKLIDWLKNLGRNISWTESDVNIRIAKAWIVIDWQKTRWGLLKDAADSFEQILEAAPYKQML